MSERPSIFTMWVKQEVAQMKVGNTSFDGIVFKSYARTIATRWPHFILVSNYWYSSTTSRHKQNVVAAARALHVPFIEVPNLMPANEREHKANMSHLGHVIERAKASISWRPDYDVYKDALATAEMNVALYAEKFEMTLEAA